MIVHTVALLVVVVGLIVGIMLAYRLAYDHSKAEIEGLEADLVTERSVRHNLNCLVTDLKHELKGKTHAIDALTGLWATDQPALIKHHAKKERFFRIGYPEHKL